MLERGERLVEGPLAEVETTDSEIGEDPAVGVIDRLRDSRGVFATGDPLGEPSELRQRPGKPGSRKHRGQPGQAEPLAGQIALEQFRVPPVKLHRSRIVTQREVGVAEAVVRDDLDAQLANDLGESEGPLP